MGDAPQTGEPQGEPTFEAALARLESIVARIEREDLELGESLALFEEGVRLLRAAETLLGAAELRVSQLFEQGESFRFRELPEEQ